MRDGGMGELRMSRAVFEAVRAHGEEAYPEECCGALLGRRVEGGWAVEAALRAGNTRTESARNRYGISAAELIGAEREAGRLGVEIAGFYHSHPECAAEWSRRDLEEAHWVGCAYVITAVAEGKATVSNSFLLEGTSEEDKRFEDQRIEVLEG